jgi:hypothetical protein
MSKEAVESVLSRAMSDPLFADALFADSEQALTGFDLTGEEVEKFKGMSRADFDTLMAAPEERKSFGVRWGAGGGGGGANHNQTALKV